MRAAAARIGINLSTLRRIENGEAMHGATLTTLLVWLMGREERPNETFTFEEEDTAAQSDQVAERNTSPAEQLSGEIGQLKTEGGESSSNTCELSFPDTTQNYGYFPETEAAIAEEQETPAELSVHVVDQDFAMCGVREERGGGGAHGKAGAGTEGAG